MRTVYTARTGYLNNDLSDGLYGLMDETEQLTLASNLVANGTFIGDASPWTIFPSASLGNNRIIVNTQVVNATVLFQNVPSLVLGQHYTVSYTISNYQFGSVRFDSFLSANADRAANGTAVETFIANSTGLNFIAGLSGFVGDISSVLVHSCSELDSIPVLMNDSFAVNLDDWIIVGPGTINAVAGTAVVDATAGVTFLRQGATVNVGTQYTLSVTGNTVGGGTGSIFIDTDAGLTLPMTSTVGEVRAITFIATEPFISIELIGLTGVTNFEQARLLPSLTDRSDSAVGIVPNTDQLFRCPANLGSTVGAYSGFSFARELRVRAPALSYNYDTFPFAMSCWAQVGGLTSTGSDISLISRGVVGVSGFHLTLSSSTSSVVVSIGTATATFALLPPVGWHSFRVQRSGVDIELYIDGQFAGVDIAGGIQDMSTDDTVVLGLTASATPLNIQISGATIELGVLSRGNITRKYNSERRLFVPYSNFQVDGGTNDLDIGIVSADHSHMTLRSTNTSLDRVNTEAVVFGAEEQWSISTSLMHRNEVGVNENIRIQEWRNFIESTNAHQTFQIDILNDGDLIMVQRTQANVSEVKAGQCWITSGISVKEIP